MHGKCGKAAAGRCWFLALAGRIGVRPSLDFLLQESFHPWSFVKPECSGLQIPLDGISPDIAGDIDEVVPVPDQPIKIVPLPKGSGGTVPSVDLCRGITLPTGDGFAQIDGLIKRKEKMDMIRHDDPGMEQVSDTVEVLEGSRYSRSDSAVAKQARAVALVEIPVDPGGEELVVFILGFSRPWLRVMISPRFSVSLQSVEQMIRKRVGKTKGEKIGGLLLLPVGKTAMGLLNLLALVEEFEKWAGVCIWFHGSPGISRPR